MLLPPIEIEGSRIVRFENRGVVDEQCKRTEDPGGLGHQAAECPRFEQITGEGACLASARCYFRRGGFSHIARRFAAVQTTE